MTTKKAYDLWTKSAQQEDPWCQYQLGRLYRDGEGVKADFDQALFWLNRAADNQTSEKAAARARNAMSALRGN